MKQVHFLKFHSSLPVTYIQGKKDSDYTRNHGWAPRGRRIRVEAVRKHGVKYNILACLTTEGIVDHYITTSNFNADLFETAFVDMVLPMLNPFPEPQSVVIMDNASFHHNNEHLQEQVADRGARIIFLPPYSCPLMPIELAFGMVSFYLLFS